MFNDKSKVANAKWKIENFKQEKKHIIDFIMEFEALVMKMKTNDIYTIFLLKKNVRSDIVKMVSQYLPIKALESLKKWKVAIISFEQEYEFIEGRQYYKIELKITYRERETSMDIRKFKDNYNIDGKPRCFNYNVNGHIAKDFPKPKKEKKTRKCYKCDKVGHPIKNCRSEQKMKNRSTKEESYNENSNKEKGFFRGLK